MLRMFSCVILLLFVVMAIGQSPITVPLTGNVMPLAGYFATVYVGTPPQAQNAILLDTGSPFFLVQNSKCKGCSTPPYTRYDINASSTAKMGSPFSTSYETCVNGHPDEDCTISGNQVHDMVSFTPGSSTVSVLTPMVDINRISPPKNTQFQLSDGTWGIAGSPLLSHYVKANNLTDLISVCFQQEGGWLVIGGLNNSLYTGAINWTDTGFSAVMSIQLNGKTFASASYIVDTGTNVTQLSPGDYKVLRNVLESICNETKLHGICDVPAGETLLDGRCYNMTDEQIAAYPNMTLNFNGHKGFTLPHAPQYYLFEYDGAKCLAFRPDDSYQIIGASLMRAYYTLFKSDGKTGFALPTKLCSGEN